MTKFRDDQKLKVGMQLAEMCSGSSGALPLDCDPQFAPFLF